MKQPDLQKLQQAQNLFQQGQKAEAHGILRELSKSYPTESALWLWLAYTADDMVFARSYLLRVKLLDPQNPSLPRAEKWLDEEEARRYVAESFPRRQTVPLRQVIRESEQRTTRLPIQKMIEDARAQAVPAQKVKEPELPPVVKVETVAPPSVETRTGAIVSNEPNPIKPRKREFTPVASVAAAPFALTDTLSPVAPVATPEAPPAKKARPKHKGWLIASIALLVLFLGLGGAIIAAIALNPPSADALKAAGLPVYSGATRLTVTPQDRDILLKGYAAGQPDQAKRLEFEFYRVKKSDKDNALNFYDTELRKLGWQAPSRNSVNANSFNLNSYQKDKQLFFVFASDVPNSADPLPSIRSQIGPNDLLLIVFRTEQV